jgi:hypothetical protein
MEWITLRAAFLPYLLLVTFYSPGINDFTAEKVTSINNSPYHGIAVQLVDLHSVNCASSNIEPAIGMFNRTCKKHVWPWIYFNRFVGAEKNSKNVPRTNSEHWLNIKGMDLYNEAGALGDFYSTWRKSLQVARRLGSPGIVVDPEPYNNYGAYKLGFVAEKISKPKDEIKNRLKEIGHELTDIADETYPEATVWLLFSALGSPRWQLLPFQEREYRTVAYVVMGMLERAAEKHSKLKFVSGGEVSLGYCSKTSEDLTAKIMDRSKSFAEFMEKFPNLRLGGTISPWLSTETKKDWLLKNGCGKSSLKTIADFEPLFKKLFETYEYVWIYAAGAAEFDPYNSVIAAMYHEVLADAFDKNAAQRAKAD